jgi:hypothetical protein
MVALYLSILVERYAYSNYRGRRRYIWPSIPYVEYRRQTLLAVATDKL